MDEARCPSSPQRKLLLEISKLPDGSYQVRPQQYPVWVDALAPDTRTTHTGGSPASRRQDPGVLSGCTPPGCSHVTLL